jgi:hypothetical protein
VARYKYTAELSASGIRKLRGELTNYKNNILQQKIDTFAKLLSEKGVNIAQMQIADYNAIFTGELISSIKSDYGGSKLGTAIFYVVADSKHAVFVEFGTGQEGLESPYPSSFPNGIDWEYNKGDSIRQATENIYVHGELFVSVGEYFWSYIGEDGKLHITKGMPSRPFMYETWAQLITIVEQTAKEVFR